MKSRIPAMSAVDMLGVRMTKSRFALRRSRRPTQSSACTKSRRAFSAVPKVWLNSVAASVSEWSERKFEAKVHSLTLVATLRSPLGSEMCAGLPREKNVRHYKVAGQTTPYIEPLAHARRYDST